MKLYLAYSLFGKPDMLSWLMEGIVDNFSPTDTQLGFFFDTDYDRVDEAFEHMRDFWLHCMGKPECNARTKPFKYEAWKSDHQVREVGGHNEILRHFMASDCDLCLIPQDDIRFLAPIKHHLEQLMEDVGPKLGIVGGRDGYDWGLKNVAGSLWSDSNPGPETWLKHGQWTPRPMMNSGPIAYTRAVIEKVGYLDEEFIAWHVWEDYGLRAEAAGFKNAIMGMDVRHAKFGRQPTAWIYETIDEVPFAHSARDRGRFYHKHADQVDGFYLQKKS